MEQSNPILIRYDHNVPNENDIKDIVDRSVTPDPVAFVMFCTGIGIDPVEQAANDFVGNTGFMLEVYRTGEERRQLLESLKVQEKFREIIRLLAHEVKNPLSIIIAAESLFEATQSQPEDFFRICRLLRVSAQATDIALQNIVSLVDTRSGTLIFNDNETIHITEPNDVFKINYMLLQTDYARPTFFIYK